MSSKDPLIALEELNEKYINCYYSKEMSIGRSVVLHRQYVKHLSFLKIIKRFFERRTEKKLQAQSACLKKQFFYNRGEVIENTRGVIYTCITRGYDNAKDPILLNDNLEYVCFTDNANQEGAWQKKDLPCEVSKYNGTLANRYCKMHPFELFENYDYAVYIDGNVRPVSDLSKLYHIAKESKSGLALHLHSRRECVYEEIEACSMYKRGNIPAVKKLKDDLVKEHFPKNFGLLEATVFVVDLHNMLAREILKDWWDILLKSETKRDQLLLPYVLWKKGMSLNDVGILGNNVYRNPMFFVSKHCIKE